MGLQDVENEMMKRIAGRKLARRFGDTLGALRLAALRKTVRDIPGMTWVRAAEEEIVVADKQAGGAGTPPGPRL